MVFPDAYDHEHCLLVLMRKSNFSPEGFHFNTSKYHSLRACAPGSNVFPWWDRTSRRIVTALVKWQDPGGLSLLCICPRQLELSTHIRRS